MFETVVMLALAPFALATLVLLSLAVVFLIVMIMQNFVEALAWLAAFAAAAAMFLLMINPELAAEIYADLFR